MRAMVRRPSLSSLALAVLAAWAAPASAHCLLCPAPVEAPRNERTPAPLSVEVDAGLDFPRVAAGPGGGSVVLAPGRPARVSGALSALGGLSMSGRVLVRGEPGRALRIDLPDRVTMRAPDGTVAELVGLTADLPPAPRLGPDGSLRFDFGGRLQVQAAVAGDYRGDIPITVDYL